MFKVSEGKLGEGERGNCAPSCKDVQRRSLATGTITSIKLLALVSSLGHVEASN